MNIKRVSFSMLVRFVRLPGIKSVCRTLYSKLCSKKSLPTCQEIPPNNLPASPTGRALWSEDQLPIWEANQYDLSVIVPFYKTEQYAEECIQSILSQETTYRFEVILVDDGSPDSCPEILDRYANHPNINVIHQPNGGVSSARNTGIRAAQGSYILFFDSDDILCPGAIQAMMSAAVSNDASIVDGAFRTMTKNGVPKRLYPRAEKTGSHGEGMSGYVAGKLYRKTLFQRVCFPEGFWFEDTIIASLLFPLSPITTTIQKEIFLYRTNPTGATLGNANNPKCIDSLYIMDVVMDASEKLGLEIRKNSMLWQLGPYLYGRIHTLPKRDIQAAFYMAADLVERYGLTESSGGSFYERELREAFVHRRYYRWKWASILM